MPRNTDESIRINKIVGKKLRELRVAAGMKREALAPTLYVTHQQLAKYETGKNRVCAARLKMAADTFKVPLEYFFEDDISDYKRDHLALEIARNIKRIDWDKKKAVTHLLKVLAMEAA